MSLINDRSADAMTGANNPNVIAHTSPAPAAKKHRIKDEPAKDKSKDASEAKSSKSSSAGVTNAEDSAKSASKHEKAVSAKACNTSAAISSTSKADPPPLHGLPPMLSPTLPDDIEEELARLTPALRGGYLSAASRVSSVSPSVGSKDHRLSVSASNQAKASTGAVTISTPQRSQDPKAITSAPRQQKTRLVILLKIKKKANRSTLSQYLKLKPTPKHPLSSNDTSKPAPAKPSSKPSRQNESSESDGPLRDRKIGARRASEKDDDDFTPDSKRRKGSGQRQGPQQQNRTSSQSQAAQKARSSRPSSTSHPNKPSRQPLTSTPQKGHLSAPINGIMSDPMQRTGSQESAATPVQPSRDATPTVPTTNTNGHSVQAPEKLKLLADVKAESNRLVALATKIKHDADAYLRLQGQAYKDNRKLGSIIATEASLCFILAAMVSDETGRSTNRLSNVDLWKSTRCYIESIATLHARPDKHLFGLMNQLEGVICDMLSYHFDMRADAVMREYNKFKEAGGAVTDPAKSEELLVSHWEIFKESRDASSQSRRAWRDGEANLFHPDIAKYFPKTWLTRRLSASRGKGRDPVPLDDYAKDGYSLPLGINTTGLEAVNFGLAFLSELAEKDGLEWMPKFGL